MCKVMEDMRNETLPVNLVVIENVDEWLTCVDCNTGKIVSWDFTRYIKEDYDCLLDFKNEEKLEVIFANSVNSNSIVAYNKIIFWKESSIFLKILQNNKDV